MQPGSANLKLCQPCEGQLNKYTNVVKGWQYRWFVLNPDKGTFVYYLVSRLPFEHHNNVNDEWLNVELKLNSSGFLVG